uniref:DNA-3-methyladenine glycosylase n=1 Tax=Sus scrofa TaxID=9823 RepID=A0A8D0XL80_PIG
HSGQEAGWQGQGLGGTGTRGGVAPLTRALRWPGPAQRVNAHKPSGPSSTRPAPPPVLGGCVAKGGRGVPGVEASTPSAGALRRPCPAPLLCWPGRPALQGQPLATELCPVLGWPLSPPRCSPAHPSWSSLCQGRGPGGVPRAVSSAVRPGDEAQEGRTLRTRHSVLVRHLGDGTELRGRIVETEAYLGPEDQAAHSRGGRQTPRNRGMFMRPGTLYVYLIYGMYFCMNVSSRGDGACVLLRALEPLGGLEVMRQLRHTVRKGAASRALKDRELCSGPSKLCQALAIDKSFDQRDLATDEAVWLERGPSGSGEPAVVAAARVGIGHAGEWAQKPLRFYIQGSPWVSVVDRAAERDAQAGHRPAHEEF